MYQDYEEIDEVDTDLAAIKNSIRNIISTARGSLPGKPNFGCDIYKILFAPLDDLTVTMANNYIRESLNEFEDRIAIEDIEITKIEEYNKLKINIIFEYESSITTNEENVDSTTISISL